MVNLHLGMETRAIDLSSRLPFEVLQRPVYYSQKQAPFLSGADWSLLAVIFEEILKETEILLRSHRNV